MSEATTGVLLLVGLPVGLVVFGGWPLPHHWPSSTQWDAFAAQPLTKPVLTAVVICLLWLIWAASFIAVTVSTARRAAARLRRLVRAPRLPTPMQATATGLLGATILTPGLPTALPIHPPAPLPPAPTAPARSPTPSQPPEPTLSRVPAGSSSHHVDTSPPAPAADAGAERDGHGWIRLPGRQWISPALAALVAAAATRVWQHRRTTYQPQALTGLVRSDPDLAPLPDTVTTVQHLQQPDVDHYHPDNPPAPIVADGPHAATLPTGALGLVGPGAEPAARAILATVLLSGDGTATAHQPDTVRAVLTATTATRLFGPTLSAGLSVTGLAIMDDLAAAVACVETIAVARILATAQPPLLLVHDATDQPGTDQDSMDPPAGNATARLDVLARVSSRLQLTILALGPWPPDGPTWTVTTDGNTTGDLAAHDNTSPRRLSVLDTETLADLVGLAAAHPEGETPSPAHAPTRRPVPTVSPIGGPTPPTSAPLWLQVMGTPQLYTSDGTPLRFPRSAALPLLVALALEPAGASTSQLGKALWPQLPSHATTHRVHTTLSTLRRILHSATGGRQAIIRTDGRYNLDPTIIDTDLRQLHQAAQAATDPAGALRHMAAVGDAALAAGWTWPWLDPHREAIRRTIADARTALGRDGPAAG